MKSGLYSIMHISTDRFYVGSARNVSHRMCAHRSLLRAGKHHSPHLQRAWDMYGVNAFRFSILEQVEPDLLLEREQFWMDRLNAYDPRLGFNVAAVAGTRVGVPHSAETKAKMSLAGKGRPKNAEHCAKIGAANKGKVRTFEMKRHLSEINIKAVTPEGRLLAAEWAKLSSGTTGKKMSPESRKKMSAAAIKRCGTRIRDSKGHFI